MSAVRLASSVALASLAVGLAVPAATEARPRPASAAPAGPVAVDVSRLRALGLGPTADLVGQALAAELSRGGLPGRVVVRLVGLNLNAYAGNDGGGGGGGGSGGGTGGGINNDYLEGEVLLLGPDGSVLSQRRQISVVPASSGGAYYQPDAERRRVVALAEHFAGWVRRSGG